MLMWAGLGRDVFGCALMRALAGTASLPFTWLHLEAILIVWLRSFVQAQHLRNLFPSPSSPIAFAAAAHKRQGGGGGGGGVGDPPAPSIFVKYPKLAG